MILYQASGTDFDLALALAALDRAGAFGTLSGFFNFGAIAWQAMITQIQFQKNDRFFLSSHSVSFHHLMHSLYFTVYILWTSLMDVDAATAESSIPFAIPLWFRHGLLGFWTDDWLTHDQWCHDSKNDLIRDFDSDSDWTSTIVNSSQFNKFIRFIRLLLSE